MGSTSRSKTGVKGKWHRAEQEEKVKRRTILPGYPSMTPFETEIEVVKYLSGDIITCLLCGKGYKRLQTHLFMIHDCTVDKYKEMYRIPSVYGLIGKEVREKLSKFMKEMHDDNKVTGKHLGSHVKEAYMNGKKRTSERYKSVKSISNDKIKRERLSRYSKQRAQMRKEQTDPQDAA